MRKKSIFAAGLTAVLISLLMSCQAEQQTETVEAVLSVRAEVVQPQSLDLSRTFTGSLTGEKHADLYAKLAEAVETVHVRQGQTVKPNQVLVSLDKTGASSQYNAAYSLFKNSEKNFEKMAYLYDEGAISESQYDGAKTDYEVNKAGFEATSRLVDIQSPIAGVVTSVDVTEGEFVNVGQKLATVATTERLRLKFGVNASDLSGVKKGSEVKVTSDATDQVATGTIVSVAGSADPATRAFEVEALIDNSDGHFSPGMFAKVELIRGRLDNVLLVPQRAILTHEGQSTLFTVNGGQSHRRTIATGATISGRVVVTSGLTPGDTVVTLGQDFLEENMAVRVTALNGLRR